MNERGFTLAELLVATAVLGIIMLGVLTVQRQGLTAYQVGAARVRILLNLLQECGSGTLTPKAKSPSSVMRRRFLVRQSIEEAGRES